MVFGDINVFNQIMNDNETINNMFKLNKYLINLVRGFPQYEKFTLSKDIRYSIKQIIRNYLLSIEVKSRRISLLVKSQEDVFDLLIHLRTAYECEYINIDQFNQLVKDIKHINQAIKETIILTSRKV